MTTLALAFELGVATRPAPGEVVCGDAIHVVPEPPGTALIVVVDGLGHGPHAAEASRLLCLHAERHAQEPLDELIRGASAALTGSRGAAAALVRLGPGGAFEFCGVGNVALQARTAKPISAWSLPGILGRRIRTPRVFSASLSAGDLVVLHTDGIGRFDIASLHSSPAQSMADDLLRTAARGHDDASCCVVKMGSST